MSARHPPGLRAAAAWLRERGGVADVAGAGFHRYAEAADEEEEEEFLAAEAAAAAAAAHASLEGCEVRVVVGGVACVALCVRHLVAEGRVRLEVKETGKLVWRQADEVDGGGGGDGGGVVKG